MKKFLILGGLFVFSSGCFAKDIRCRFVWVDAKTEKVLKSPKPSQWHTGAAACFALVDRLEVLGPLVSGPVNMGVQFDGSKAQKEEFYQNWKKRGEQEEKKKAPTKDINWTGAWRG